MYLGSIIPKILIIYNEKRYYLSSFIIIEQSIRDCYFDKQINESSMNFPRSSTCIEMLTPC
jgi:hypothetical protein